jgi:hypothetical protein
MKLSITLIGFLIKSPEKEKTLLTISAFTYFHMLSTPRKTTPKRNLIKELIKREHPDEAHKFQTLLEMPGQNATELPICTILQQGCL